MIKGWKLDPAWRDYYERRCKEKLELDDRLTHLRWLKAEVKVAHTLGRMQAEAEGRNARIGLAANALRRFSFGGEK